MLRSCSCNVGSDTDLNIHNICHLFIMFHSDLAYLFKWKKIRILCLYLNKMLFQKLIIMVSVLRLKHTNNGFKMAVAVGQVFPP